MTARRVGNLCVTSCVRGAVAATADSATTALPTCFFSHATTSVVSNSQVTPWRPFVRTLISYIFSQVGHAEQDRSAPAAGMGCLGRHESQLKQILGFGLGCLRDPGRPGAGAGRPSRLAWDGDRGPGQGQPAGGLMLAGAAATLERHGDVRWSENRAALVHPSSVLRMLDCFWVSPSLMVRHYRWQSLATWPPTACLHWRVCIDLGNKTAAAGAREVEIPLLPLTVTGGRTPRIKVT
jgi:hypothetical protein